MITYIDILGKRKQIDISVLHRYCGHSIISIYIQDNILLDDVIEGLLKQTKAAETRAVVLDKDYKEFLDNSKFCSDYYLYKFSDKSMRCVDYFKSLGYTGFSNYKEFHKKFSFELNKISWFSKEKEEVLSLIWNDAEITEFKRLWHEEEVKLQNAYKEQEEKTLKEKEDFLKPFKNGCQKCISLIDDKTHHYLNREEEINLYLNYGYELANADLLSKVVVWLKPSKNYKYTKEFEDALLKLKGETNENCLFRAW